MHLRTSQSAAGLPAMSAGARAFAPVSQATANALVDALVETSSRPQARAIVDRLLRMQGHAAMTVLPNRQAQPF